MDDYILNDDGQFQLNTNYKGPANGELVKIWTPLLMKMGKTTVLAEKAMVMSIKNLRYRDPSSSPDSEEEKRFAKIAEETHGVDGFTGYISEMTCLELLTETESGTGGSAYQRVYRLMKDRVFKNSWSIIADNGSHGYTEIEAITATHVDEDGHIYISWNDEVAKKINELKENYTLYDEKLLYGFNSDIAIQLYKILKRNMCLADHKRKKQGLPVLDEYEFKMNLSELKFQVNDLQVDTTSKNSDDIEVIRLLKAEKFEDAEALVVKKEAAAGAKTNYHEYKYFKRDKLSKAFLEINGFAEPKVSSAASDDKPAMARAQKNTAAILEYERLCNIYNSTDIHFRYSRRRNMPYISFFVRWADLAKEHMNEEQVIEGKYTEVPDKKPASKKKEKKEAPVVEVNQDDVLEEMLELSTVPELRRLKNLRVIAEDAGWDIERIKKAFRVFEQQESDNPVGFLREAVRNGWEPSEKKEKKEKKETNKGTKSAKQYNSYASHSYTEEQMSEIQKALLKKVKQNVKKSTEK